MKIFETMQSRVERETKNWYDNGWLLYAAVGLVLFGIYLLIWG